MVLVKDQLRARMEQLGIKVPGLAKQLEVSEQTVRFWLNGRNLPGKNHRAALEAALSCSINWSESARAGERPSATSLLEQTDVEIMLKMSRLPMSVKILFGKLAEEIVSAQHAPAFSEQEIVRPMKSFSVKSQGSKQDGKTRRRHPTAKKRAA